ncbi:MAG: type II toxin-antitoxin system RelE/ParE family toxin [Candidatus Methanomethylophilaceae archaeon]|nr:type II toxin-antitoxin system RelE/ParE family toxin [Candidatus Methanomethylophilaceae archaeon]
MGYRVELSKRAQKDLDKFDGTIVRMILKWLKKNIDNSDDPRIHEKALKGNLAGYWRYRVGSYRIICTIEDDRLIVQVITINNRRNVYEG